MKLFCIVGMRGGDPNINQLPHCGYTHAASVGNWGTYLFSGTAEQLTAINALPNVFGIVAVTQSGAVRWAELDGTISAAVRSRLNTWLTARSYPTIPAGWTYRRVILAIFNRLNDKFDLNSFDVME